MAGINLSQSFEEKRSQRSRSYFDKGLFSVIALAVMAVAGWGGLRWYLSRIDSQTTGLQSQIDAAKPTLEGDTVDQLVDFSARLDTIAMQAPKRVEVAGRFGYLEKVTLPNIVLTKYEFDETGQAINIEGISNDFRSLAQQLITFKSEPELSNIWVEEIKNTEDGKIKFTLKAALSLAEASKN